MTDSRVPTLPNLKYFFEDDDPVSNVFQVVSNGTEIQIVRLGDSFDQGFTALDISAGGIVIEMAWSTLANPQSGADLAFTITGTKLVGTSVAGDTGLIGFAPSAANWSTLSRALVQERPAQFFYDIQKTENALRLTLGKGKLFVFNDVTMT